MYGIIKLMSGYTIQTSNCIYFKQTQMKKIILMLFGVFVTLALTAQPLQRPVPNQFRDFVNHQEKWNTERPQIERKDGKVIITMTEEHFQKMRSMRHRQMFQHVKYRPQPQCPKCEIRHKNHLKKKF